MMLFNKIFCLLILLFLIAFNLYAKTNVNSDVDYMDAQAGEEFPFASHYYSKIPKDYLPDIWTPLNGFSALYFGESRYKGDRRFNPYICSYSIDIKIKNRFDISVDWICNYRPVNSSKVTKESPIMAVENVKYGSSSMIWGDMYFTAAGQIKSITNPFIAVFVIRLADHSPGILLFGRYEGTIFIPRAK